MPVLSVRPLMITIKICCFFFFFNDTATTEIYTLSLHDALPISSPGYVPRAHRCPALRQELPVAGRGGGGARRAHGDPHRCLLPLGSGGDRRCADDRDRVRRAQPLHAATPDGAAALGGCR